MLKVISEAFRARQTGSDIIAKEILAGINCEEEASG